jgi:hypothetical protein
LKTFRIRLCCLLLVCSPLAQSADILSIEVDSEKGAYTMTSDAWFDAPVEQVYEVYRHWDYATRFSSAIVEARDLPPDEQGRAQFYVRNRGCILFFCKSFVRQGYIEAKLNEVVRAFADPETSDFYYSNESWQFVARDGGTVVSYNLSMQPKFWVPPGIGPYLIKRKLKKNGDQAVDRIERIAQEIETQVAHGE